MRKYNVIICNSVAVSGKYHVVLILHGVNAEFSIVNSVHYHYPSLKSPAFILTFLCVKGQHAAWPGFLSAVFHSQLEPKLPKQAVGLQAQELFNSHRDRMALELRSRNWSLANAQQRRTWWGAESSLTNNQLWPSGGLSSICVPHFKDRRGLLPVLEAVGILVFEGFIAWIIFIGRVGWGDLIFGCCNGVIQ